MYYVGLDVHKKSISYCVKLADGGIVSEGSVAARRLDLSRWARDLPQPWSGAMEATLFSHWIYDHLVGHAHRLQMGHPARMRAISAGKKKSDRLDARTIADLLRCDLLPPAYVMPASLRRLRQVLRYRNLLVRASVRMQNKIAGLLMELGIEYEVTKLGGKKYFRRLLAEQRPEIPDSAAGLLSFCRQEVETIGGMERQLLAGLQQHLEIAERVKRLMTIPGVGPVLALTWVLEVGPTSRLSSIAKAISFCGLSCALRESAGVQKRGPLSKQRNPHLQTVLVEAAHVATRWNPLLAAVRAKEEARGNKNRATLAVARKLVAYLMAADRGRQPRAQSPEPPPPAPSPVSTAKALVERRRS
jgi:transposase